MLQRLYHPSSYGADVPLLESNHDVCMLEAGRYPYYLKKRILGERSSSNEDCGRLLSRVHDGMKQVYLGHLSKENNYEELAYETVCSEVTMGDNPYNSKDFCISIATGRCHARLSFLEIPLRAFGIRALNRRLSL